MSNGVFDLNEQNSNLSSKIVVSLEKISGIFHVLLWEKAKALGLSPIQIQLLIFIETHEYSYCKVSYMAHEFNLTKPTISDAVKSLVSKKMVSKVKDENDTRSYFLELTETGKTTADQLMSFSNGLGEVVNSLPDKNKEELWGSLLSILTSFNKKGTISLQRMCMNCKYYQNSDEPYCNFLNQKLQPTDIRIDCPEHILVKE